MSPRKRSHCSSPPDVRPLVERYFEQARSVEHAAYRCFSLHPSLKPYLSFAVIAGGVNFINTLLDPLMFPVLAVFSPEGARR